MAGALECPPRPCCGLFVRGDGDDASPGTSAKTAWHTIDRVNHARLQPGDSVVFESGKSFAGSLRLTADDAGTSNAPVTITSSGDKPATILAGSTNGITVENAAGSAIKNLAIVGAGRTNNTGNGILCENHLADFKFLDHLDIENVEARGFGGQGILISGDQGGFRHVRVTDCVMRDNLRGGMEVAGRLPYDSSRYAHADVIVSHCRAFDNTGDPSYLRNHSGSGIVLYQVDGGTIEDCAAWNNGSECRSPTGGGVGLWTCASRHVVIQRCESFGNKTSGADGGGFDIDGGSEDCVLQYNYSHDNDGPGLMVYTYAYAPHEDHGNVVRFNIAENDSRKNRRYAGLWVRSDGKGMTGLEIYNNTVIEGPWADQAAYVNGEGVEAHLRNNIFMATGGAIPLRADQPGNALRFENNLYWRDGREFQITWGARGYEKLEAWRNGAGQESLGGQPLGFFENPALSEHPPGVRADEFIERVTLRAFRPLPNSPVMARGLDLRSRFGLKIGSSDFFGIILPTGGGVPLGAVSGQVQN